MASHTTGALTGPRLVAGIAIGIAAMCALIVVVLGPGPEAAHAVVRWTARTSLVLFALAYVARPLVQLRPTRPARGILARRKWLGLGFAASHFAHLIGILAIAWPDPGAFVRGQNPTIVIALATFLLLFAMAITSIENVKRKINAGSWKKLHRTGMHFAWVAFAGTYTPALAVSPLYALPVAVLLAIGAVRLAAWLRARRRAKAQTSRTRAHFA